MLYNTLYLYESDWFFPKRKELYFLKKEKLRFYEKDGIHKMLHFDLNQFNFWATNFSIFSTNSLIPKCKMPLLNQVRFFLGISLLISILHKLNLQFSHLSPWKISSYPKFNQKILDWRFLFLSSIQPFLIQFKSLMKIHKLIWTDLIDPDCIHKSSLCPYFWFQQVFQKFNHHLFRKIKILLNFC